MYLYFKRFITGILSISIGVLIFSFSGCDDNTTGSEKDIEFDSGNISAGGTYSQTFQNTGTVEYYCSIHTPDMQGKVHVEEGASSTDPDTVKMVNTQFQPTQITVSPNTKIIWINEDSFAHTVTSGNPGSNNNGGGGGGY